LGASVVALRSFKGSNEDSHALQRTYGLVDLGFILAFASQFIPFPVGCNLDAWPYNLTNVFHGCPASPEGVWSTIWPNALSTCVGVVLVTTEYGKLRSRDAVLPGLGVGFMVSGFLLLIQGLTIGYFTSCPANGCLPLTAGQWWSLFWPDVVADTMGTALILAGSAILIMRWRLKAKQATPSEIGPLFPSGPSQYPHAV
jgi:hypothetical protein